MNAIFSHLISRPTRMRQLSLIRRGMTLAEVVVAMAVFSMLAGGILSMALWVRSSMNETQMRNIAFDAAGALLDQVKMQKIGTLKTANDTNGKLTLSVCDYANNSTAALPLTVNSTAYYTLSDKQRIPFNHTDKTGKMVYIPDFAVRLVLTPQDGGSLGTGNALLATLHYKYTQTAPYGRVVVNENTVSYLVPNI